MKDSIWFLLFIFYTIAVFFLRNGWILGTLFLLQIGIMLKFSISLKEALQNLKALSFFILLTVGINSYFSGLTEALLLMFRLIIFCNITYIFSHFFSAYRLAEVIEKLLYPLKLVNIKPENIGIIVAIAISFIPILRSEVNRIEEAFIAKGFPMKGWRKMLHIQLLLQPLFVSLLKRITQLERCLKAKAYQEE